MPADVLVHLVEPATWRAALRDGAVRPPSLTTAGFVHLSTPDQVHLPAERLYAGRRDLVLLAVDPARLTDPVRFEPGVPGDPAGMRFPHLYGPLPVTAVIAVVPYLPPAPVVLPAPDDRLGRGLALFTSLPIRRAAQVRNVAGGVAVLDPQVGHSQDNNRVLFTEPVDAPTVEAVVAEIADDAGWPHRAAGLMWPRAADVAAELGRRGWQTQEVVLMARPARPAPGGERAEIVDQPELHGFWERSWRQTLAGRPGLEEVVAHLIAREQLNDRFVAVTDVVVREAGRVVAAAQLRVDGATAAVDSVLTAPEARGRGHADAALARVLVQAAAAGCDLVVLEAAADDWPRHWYARRGFEPVGSTWGIFRQAGASAESRR